MFYTIYKITNKINGKIYIGKHQTKDLNDGYMGSGKYIIYSIEKYGIENFEKEILFQFHTEAEMNLKEAELVTDEFCLREDTYNLCPGGKGGFGYINSDPEIIEKRDKYEYKFAGRIAADIILKEKYGSNWLKVKLETDENFKHNFSQKVSEGLKKYYSVHESSWKGRTHTEETKTKMRKSKNVGVNNPQFGSMWITNGTDNKRIKKTDLVPEGWYKGRVI